MIVGNKPIKKKKIKEELIMANRIRNERLEIKLTEEEKALFEEKRKLSKCRNMSHFIRKCVLEKEILT